MLDRELIVYSLEKELGFKIGDFKSTIYGRKICSACGAIKRYLLNKIAYDLGLTKVATGHNLDDTVEALFNFYLEGNIVSLLRLKPLLPRTHPKLVPKIKPLIKLTDMECLLYARYRNLPTRTVECQFSRGSRMLRRKELLNMVRFDEAFNTPTGFREESDFQQQIKQRGYKLLFIPQAYVLHLAPEEGGNRPGMDIKRRMYWKIRNHTVFILKWNNSTTKRIWYLFLATLILLIYRPWHVFWILKGLRDGVYTFKNTSGKVK